MKEETVITTGGNPRIKKCTCQHDFQSERYGSNMRVHTPTEKGKWRCTVCGKENN